MDDILERMRKALDQSSGDQKGLAAFLGVKSEGYVSELLSGRADKRWNLPHFLGFCRYVGLPASAILGDFEDAQHEAFLHAVPILTPEVVDWVLELDGLELKVALRGAQDAVLVHRARKQ